MITKDKKITFIGGGNMTHAIVKGLIKANYPSDLICVTNPGEEKRLAFEKEFRVITTKDNKVGVEAADIVILSVKPQLILSVCEEIKSAFKDGAIVVSVAFGIKLAAIQQAVGDHIMVVRAMPNTPTAVGAGATGLYAAPTLSDEARHCVQSVISLTGLALWVEKEDLIDAVTAISGSGPAYIFLIIEALRDAGEQLGLSAVEANKLAIQTILGAGEMAVKSEADVKQLRASVTSKGGTTEVAISTLESGNLRDLLFKAVRAAFDRAQE